VGKTKGEFRYSIFNFPFGREEFSNRAADAFWPIAQKYWNEKAAYDRAIGADAKYNSDRANALAALSSAHAAETHHATIVVQARVSQSNQDESDFKSRLRKLTRITAELVQAEKILWNGLIDVSPNACTDIYDQILNNFLIYQAGA
jgi:hypothetical protein